MNGPHPVREPRPRFDPVRVADEVAAEPSPYRPYDPTFDAEVEENRRVDEAARMAARNDTVGMSTGDKLAQARSDYDADPGEMVFVYEHCVRCGRDVTFFGREARIPKTATCSKHRDDAESPS